ncbi:zinc ribbon domain-containing protein [Halostella litorea]|uniref:zinc ribbon domain-containing protein n=1 Tax=Halostella litorea TaxID=2528831 RepID=UPI001091A86A|nr:zinc ribbon domain-containing protein [Halostella litorea]
MKCDRCSTTIQNDEWFCSYCGKKRPTCPDCGTDYSQAGGDGSAPARQCPSCNLPRKAGCPECDAIIDATRTACPNCGNDAAEDRRGRTGKFKTRAIVFGVGIPVGAWLLFSGLPGILTWALWIPAAVMGGIGGLWYRQRMKVNADKIRQQFVGEFSAAQKQHESYNYRQEKKEQRKKERKRKRRRERARRTVVDMNCPVCGHGWLVREGQVADVHHGEGVNIIGSEQYGRIEVQCNDCNHTRRLQVE